MKIARLESLHADAGQRNFDFLKITTDDGLVGWSAPPSSPDWLPCSSAGGVVQQAIGAIENALLDLKARALGIPVYELLGGPVRDRIRLYWSHCGTYRLAWAGEMQIPPLRTLDDVVKAGKEVAAAGHTAPATRAPWPTSGAAPPSPSPPASASSGGATSTRSWRSTPSTWPSWIPRGTASPSR